MKRSTPLKRTGFKPKVSAKPGILRTATLTDLKKVQKLRTKKCKNPVCRTSFTPRSMTHVACSTECSIEVAQLKREKKQRQEAKADRAITRAKINALRPRKWHMKTLKTELHAFIRERDEGKICISCDTVLVKFGRVGGDYDAGHFRSVGSASHMRYLENNIHGQCKYCNDHLAGNPHAYEQGLLKRYGKDYVDALKADNEIRKYTIDDLITMTRIYKLKRKDLHAARAEKEAI